MRIAILSDIHGNLSALRAVAEHLQRQEIERVVVAGDMATAGPQPEETMRFLIARGWPMLLGNHEVYVRQYHDPKGPAAWRDSKQWAALRWACRQLSPESVALMQRLPAGIRIEAQGPHALRICHGSHRSPSESLIPEGPGELLDVHRRAGALAEDEVPPPLITRLDGLIEANLVCGHTHIPWVWHRKGRMVVNAGSVGAPINDDVRAQYVLLTLGSDGWRAAIRAVRYPVDETLRAYRQGGMLEEGGAFAYALYHDVANAQNTSFYLVKHAERVANHLGVAQSAAQPDPVWERAVATFPWSDWGLEPPQRA